MTFEAFRKYGAPTFYEAVHIPWEGDILASGLLFCFAILVFSFYIILPGLVGKEKVFSFVRITVSMFIGMVILVSNFAMTWETAKTRAVTKYKAGTGQEVNVTIGVNIGFRGVNITLKGQKDQIPGETIDYNENFNWEGLQGRLGFGPNAGQFNQQFRAAQLRGVPLPILAVAEYFTIDGEGIRWGRYYRQAGWYSHIVLWLAFPLWILSNIFFFVLLRYGAYFTSLTGLCMVTSNIIWATLRNPMDLEIHFANDMLLFSFGTAFWVCLSTGIFCVILGIAVFLLDKLFPSQAAMFFGVDILQDSENITIEDEGEFELDTRDTTRSANQDAVDSSSAPAPQHSDAEDDEDDETVRLYKIPSPPEPVNVLTPDAARPVSVNTQAHKKSFRSSELRLTKKLQRPRRRDPPPRPPPRVNENVVGHYVNAPPKREEPRRETQHVTFGEFHNQVDPLADESFAVVRMTNYEKV